MPDIVRQTTTIHEISFRDAVPSDAVNIVELVNQAYRPAQQYRGWTHEAELVTGQRTDTHQVNTLLQRKNSLVLLALKEAVIVGCVHMEMHVENVHTLVEIGMLAVCPTLQDNGLGKQLLARAEQQARGLFSPEKFRIQVVAPRTELIAFYHRRGYQNTGKTLDYPLTAGVGTPTQQHLKVETLEKPGML